MLVAGGIVCGFLLVWILIGILIAVWVYTDANSRGMSGIL